MLDQLTDINLDDLFDAAGLMRLRRTYLQHLLRPCARRFALLALEFDRRVGEQGLAHGSAWLAHRMAAGTQVSGREHVPAAGPAVILANHPGMTDTVALLASLASRPDLRVIALDRPFLRALPNVSRRLILVPERDVGRMGVVRAGVKHLQQGGALLTFPAGEIEPDPARYGRLNALESVNGWSKSFVLFARRMPGTRFIPAIVSNVVSPDALGHALTFLRHSVRDKQRLAAALQVALPRYQRLVARVAFGPAQEARASAVNAPGVDARRVRSLHAAVLVEARRLIETTDSAAGTGASWGRSDRNVYRERMGQVLARH